MITAEPLDGVLALAGLTQQKVLIGLLAVALATWLISGKLLSDSELRKFYASQPSPGLKQEWFPWLRGTLRSFNDTATRVSEGYNKVGRFASISLHKSLSYEEKLRVEHDN